MIKEIYLDNIQETAKALYQLSIDMDYSDYSETLTETLTDIENALYYLKAICQNEYNNDYFRTFARCLDLITETTTINDNIFEGDL